MPVQGPTRTKKSKKKDDRPSRKKYWLRRTLEKHKVKQLMRFGYTRKQALDYWHKVRLGRVPAGFLRKVEV